MDKLELLPQRITVENMQGSHHPGNRSLSRCWHAASWQRRVEDCAQNSPHCFGYNTCILEQFLGRNPPQLCPRKECLIITIPVDKGRRRTLVNQLNAFVVGSNLLECLRNSESDYNVVELTAFRSLSTSRMFRHPELPGYFAGLSIM